MGDDSSVLFWLKLYMLLTKVAHQSPNFHTSHCSHENSPNSSWHFWTQKSVILETLHHSSVSWEITFLYLFILIFVCFGKRVRSKFKFSDSRLLAWKLTKLLMSFLEPQVSFPLNFATPLSVIIHNSSEIFCLKLCFGQKEPINVQFFRLLGALMKVHPIPHAIFETTRSGFIQILHHCSVSWKITPPYILAQTSYTLDKNSPLK